MTNQSNHNNSPIPMIGMSGLVGLVGLIALLLATWTMTGPRVFEPFTSLGHYHDTLNNPHLYLLDQGQPLPFAEEDLMEMRQLARLVLDFADEADLMARGRRAALELKISDELKRMAERSNGSTTGNSGQ